MNFLDTHLVQRLDFAVAHADYKHNGTLSGQPGEDISVITHIDEKQLEVNDLEALEGLAGVRLVLPENEGRYAILNADDDLVYELRDELFCEIVLFSIYSENRRIKRHCRRGGLAAIIEDDRFVLCKGERKIPLMKLPLAAGQCKKTARELLPFILTAMIRNFSIREISRSLQHMLSKMAGESGNGRLFSA
jgi:cyanophycin synthetase